jgi:hypothetical protein
MRKEVRFDESDRGLWDIWELPDQKEKREYLYCLGADVAEGIAVVPELGLRGGDFSVAKILKRDTKTFIARCRGRIDPDLFAEELWKAAVFWKHLHMMIENNPGGSGNVVIRDLKGLEGVSLMRGPTLKKVHDERKDEYGWRTLKDTKREMIDELVELVRDQTFTDPSKNFWIEASTYIRDEKGLTNAQSRKFDDEIIATALAFQAHNFLPAIYNSNPNIPKPQLDPGTDVPENWERWAQRRAGAPSSQAAVMEKTYANF